MCNTCEWFYLGQTTNLKQRIRKHKSDVFHPQNSFCKKCSEHLRDCSRMKEPFFRIYPFSYENKKELREFKEKRFIMSHKVCFFLWVFWKYIYQGIYIYPSFSFCWPLLHKVIKLNPKVYDLINWLKKNLNTYCLISWEGY